ncbi:MAG: hypothetical protein LBR38_00085 [Synergistaceae bacterium]|nr:hypothetical protein [Synergistaceae bacterium]
MLALALQGGCLIAIGSALASATSGDELASAGTGTAGAPAPADVDLENSLTTPDLT